MKKILSIFLSLTLTCSVSCGKKESDTNNDIDFSKANTVQFNEWNQVILNDGMLRFNEGGNPSLLDFNTLEEMIFCNDPGCTHTTSSCIAMTLKSFHQLPVIYNGSAYYFSNTQNQVDKDGKRCVELKASIIRYDIENMQTSTVGTLDGYNVSSCDGSGSYLIDSEYYFFTNNGDPIYDEAGNVLSTSNSGQAKLYSVNLDTEKITDHGEIFNYEEYKKDPDKRNLRPYFIGKHLNFLYIRLDMGNGTIYSPELYIFDTDTKKFTQHESVLSKSVVDGYLLYYTSDGKKTGIDKSNLNSDIRIYLENLDTGEVTEGPHPEYANMSIGGRRVWYDNCCYDIKTGKSADVPELSDYLSCNYLAEYDGTYIIFAFSDSGEEILKIPVKNIDKLFQ